MVNVCVQQKDDDLYHERTRGDSVFDRFHRILPIIQRPSLVWRVAKHHPYMLDTCVKVAKVIAEAPAKDELLCEYCGCLFKDFLVHYICQCSETRQERDHFWNIRDNQVDIAFAAFLYNAEDCDFVDLLLGAPCDFLDNIDDHIHFLRMSFNYIAKVMDKVPCLNS